MIEPKQIVAFEKACQEYEERFKAEFPIPDEDYDSYVELIEIINFCLKKNKDVYELGIYEKDL